jgi:hypothetical protein
VKDEKLEMTEERWKKYQKRFGYTDEELAIYKSRPEHVKAMEEAAGFARNNIIIDIIEARNCAAGYKAGDKFVVNGEGMLLADQSPPTLCVGAIYGFKTLIDRVWQSFFLGSTEVLHNTVRCPDVGVERGGWGEITMRVRVVPKK